MMDYNFRVIEEDRVTLGSDLSVLLGNAWGKAPPYGILEVARIKRPME